MLTTGEEADAAGAAAAGIAAGAGDALKLPAPATSNTRIKLPSETLSPTAIFNCFTTPAFGEGISIAALSDSSVINEVSASITSPSRTSTSMTSTSLKLPMSGTQISSKPVGVATVTGTEAAAPPDTFGCAGADAT